MNLYYFAPLTAAPFQTRNPFDPPCFFDMDIFRELEIGQLFDKIVKCFNEPSPPLKRVTITNPDTLPNYKHYARQCCQNFY